MITIEALVPPLQGKLLVDDTAGRPVQAVVASDLMSDVLVVTREDFLLVTSLASDQMIRTADLVGAAGVVLVNGKQPPASSLKLAKDLTIALIASPLPKYEACLAIGAALATVESTTKSQKIHQ
jgi:hypothetical protein